MRLLPPAQASDQRVREAPSKRRSRVRIHEPPPKWGIARLLGMSSSLGHGIEQLARQSCARLANGVLVLERRRSTGCHLGPGAGDLPKRFRRKMIACPVACAQLLDAEGFVARRPTSRSERLSLGEGCRARPCPSARPGSPRALRSCADSRRGEPTGPATLMSKWQSSAPPSRPTIHSSQSRSAASCLSPCGRFASPARRSWPPAV